MKRAVLVLAACVCLGAGAVGWRAVHPVELPPALVLHPDGTITEVKDCSTGCSAPTPDESSPLDEVAFLEALANYQQEPPISAGIGLETLLFHGNAQTTQDLLARLGPGPLDVAHRRALDQELSRDQVRIQLRLVDEHDTVRGQIDQVIPLKEKQHLVLEGTGGLKRAEVNGKVKRVGLHHLWTRW